jgi:hypothetical protein
MRSFLVGFFCSFSFSELFPGLIYRMQVPKVVLLIFVSGKVVLTGAKRVEGKALKLLLLVVVVAIVTHSCSCSIVVDIFFLRCIESF